MNRFHSLRRRRGQSLVEFVLVLPFLLLLMLGVYEVTRVISIYTVMTDLAGDTARLWSKPAYHSYTQANLQAIIFDSLQENFIDTSRMTVFVETGIDPDEATLNYRQVAIRYNIDPIFRFSINGWQIIDPNINVMAIGRYVEERAFY